MPYDSSRSRSAVVMVAAILTLLGSGFLLLAPNAKTRPDAALLATQKLLDQSTIARPAEQQPPQEQRNLPSDRQ